MKTAYLTLGALLLAVSAQADFNAGIISLDIYETQFSSDPPYGPGAGAIGSSGDFWNGLNIAGNVSTAGGMNGLQTSDGTVTSVGLTLQSSLGGGTETGTYALLLDTYCLFAAPSQTDQITGLTPNAQYDLFLYSPHNRSGISVNGISFSSPVASAPYNSLIAGTDYSEHIVTADSSGNLNMTEIIDATHDSGFSAFQLEAIPEPSTLALGTLVVLIACRRKVKELL